MDSNENKYGGMLAMLCNDLSSIKSKLSTNMKFHDTRYAQFFFDRHVPKTIRILERIAVALEEQNKILSKTDNSESVETINTEE